MATTTRYGGLAATHQGRTNQINRAFQGLADKLERQKAEQPSYDDLSSLSPHQLRRLVMKLQQDLVDAQRLIEDMRHQANSDPFAEVSKKVAGWGTARVAEASGKSIATICRHATELGGMKIGSDWVFPAGTRYAGGRKKKNSD